MVNVNVSDLIEQTNFLLTKQHQSTKDFNQLFDAFLASLRKVLDSEVVGSDDHASLERIYDLVSERAEVITQEAQEEIGFLEEQLDALREVSKIGDAKRSQELLSELIGDDDTDGMLTTQELKDRVEADYVAAREGLVAVLDDMQAAIEERDFVTLETMLLSDIDEDGEEEDEDEDGDESEDDEYSCNSGCSGCPTGCSAPKDKATIFGSFSDYDETLARELQSDLDDEDAN